MVVELAKRRLKLTKASSLQFIPRLIAQLEKSLSRGVLGSSTAGSCFLARHQNRLVFFRVIESGFLYRCIEAKGLELQETSCHTLEAAKVSLYGHHEFHEYAQKYC